MRVAQEPWGLPKALEWPQVWGRSGSQAGWGNTEGPGLAVKWLCCITHYSMGALTHPPLMVPHTGTQLSPPLLAKCPSSRAITGCSHASRTSLTIYTHATSLRPWSDQNTTKHNWVTFCAICTQAMHTCTCYHPGNAHRHVLPYAKGANVTAEGLVTRLSGTK